MHVWVCCQSDSQCIHSLNSHTASATTERDPGTHIVESLKGTGTLHMQLPWLSGHAFVTDNNGSHLVMAKTSKDLLGWTDSEATVASQGGPC